MRGKSAKISALACMPAAQRRQSLAHGASHGDLTNSAHSPGRGERTSVRAQSFLRPYRGCSLIDHHPRLTPWAKICRRFAADSHTGSAGRWPPSPAGLILSLYLSILTCFAGVAAAAPPAAAPAHPSSIESQPIRRAATNDSPQTTDAPDTDHSGNFELPRVAGALAIVLALIFILRWGGLRIFNSPTSQKSSRSVQVLSRSVLAPRQHILLVQVGKRVLVVGDSGGQMSSLCQITDANEIAALVGQIRDEKLSPATGAFKSIFRRQKPDEPTAAEMRDDWTESNVDVPAGEQSEEQDLSETRSELSGLMDKVRLLSKQLKNG